MNKKKIHLLAQCIVNRTLGKDIMVQIEPMGQTSCVGLVGSPWDNKNHAKYFIFGCFNEDQKDREWYKIIQKRFPIATTVEPAMFAILHEVGHVFAPASLTDRKKREEASTSLEYRDLPDEMFADSWAASFITKNKMIVKLWNKQLIEAL